MTYRDRDAVPGIALVFLWACLALFPSYLVAGCVGYVLGAM